MIARLMPGRRPAKEPLRGRKPTRGKAGRFVVISLAAGMIAALLAIVIATLPTLVTFAFSPNNQVQFNANTLFPAPSPIHKTITIYDPAPPRPTPRATPTDNPHPTPSPQPSPSHGGDD